MKLTKIKVFCQRLVNSNSVFALKTWCLYADDPQRFRSGGLHPMWCAFGDEDEVAGLDAEAAVCQLHFSVS